MEFKFKHEEDSILKALGTNIKEVRNLFDKINEVANNCSCTSEVVEKLGDNFTAHELAFIITDLKEQLDKPSNPMEMLTELLSDRVSDASGLPLGEKGEA